MKGAVGYMLVAAPFILAFALVLLLPSLNRTWRGSLISHATSLLAAVLLGRSFAFLEWFGAEVGDPPYGTGEAEFNFGAIWLKATVYVLATLYVLRAAMLLAAKGVHRLKGAH